MYEGPASFAEGLFLGYFCTLAGYPLVPAQIAAVCWLAVPGLQAWALAVQASIGQARATLLTAMACQDAETRSGQSA